MTIESHDLLLLYEVCAECAQSDQSQLVKGCDVMLSRLG